MKLLVNGTGVNNTTYKWDNKPVPISQSRAFYIVMLIIISTFAITACNSTKTTEYIHAVDEINIRNSQIQIPDVDLVKYTNSPKEEELLTEKELERLFSRGSSTQPKGCITKSEAMEDVDLLFRALKTNYGLYEYYGGDYSFEKAKQDIVDYINLREEVDVTQLGAYMKGIFSFVKDKHFRINGSNNSFSEIYYHNEKLEIFRDDSGYYNLVNNGKQYIKSINGDSEIEKYMKLSVNDKGRLIYVVGVLQQDNYKSIDEVEVLYEVEDRELKERVFLKKSSTYDNIYEKNIEIEYIDRIPVIFLRKVMFVDSKDYKDFIKTAESTQQAKITILDLRGNWGGDSLCALKWIEGRFGAIPKGNSAGFRLLRYGDCKVDIDKELEGSDFQKYMGAAKLQNNYYKTWVKEDGILLSNDGYIFILVDKRTASSAELFVDYLRCFKNVIVVGTNTSGAIEGSMFEPGYLPNSNIEFSYGNDLRIFSSTYFQEGRGLAADIWVEPDLALEKVLDLVKYYNIK